MSCLLLCTAYVCVGHERMYVWIIYIFSKVFLLWMNHYSCIGLLWSSVLFTVSLISWSVFSPPKMFLFWELFQMCISHGIQFSHAFWQMHRVAKMILAQRCCGLTKRWIPFAFIYGIDYSFGMVKSVSTLGPSGKKKDAPLFFSPSWEGSLCLLAILFSSHWSAPLVLVQIQYQLCHYHSVSFALTFSNLELIESVY